MIMVNNNQVLALRNSFDMGCLKGFTFNFEGAGSIDYVMISTLDNDTIYFESF